MSVLVRHAALSDSVDILTWRNDAVTRKMSRNSEPVSAIQHEQWFENAIKSEQKFVLICEDHSDRNSKLGMIRFDLYDSSDEAEVSINLNPEFRGRGFAKICLSSGMDYFRSQCPQITKIYAEVRLENNVSLHLFESLGFKVFASSGGLQRLLYSSSKT